MKNLLIHFFLTMLILISEILFAAPNISRELEGYDIIVVAGQSNAVGFGIPDAAAGNDQDVIDSQIFQIGRLNNRNLKIAPLTEYTDEKGILHKFIEHWGTWDRWNLTGFAIPFARLYAKTVLKPGRKILLVPAACAGSSILEWVDSGNCKLLLQSLRASNPQATLPPLYSDMVDRVSIALKQPGHNRIVAFLWQQGETDAGQSDRIFLEKLNTFFFRVRHDLKLPESCPLLAGTFVPNWLSGTSAFENKQKIQSALKQALSKDPFAAVVDTDGLSSNFEAGLDSDKENHVHFSGASQRNLGERYFIRWQELTQRQILLVPNPGPNWQVIGSKDINNDGQTDILFSNLQNHILAWTMKGLLPLFGMSVTENGFKKPASVAYASTTFMNLPFRLGGVADFNKDGTSDLIWQSNQGALMVWLMDDKERKDEISVPAGTSLVANQTIQVVDKKLVMQTDGNLVLYDQVGRPLWAISAFPKNYLNNSNYDSNRDCQKCLAQFQGDGNLVLYRFDEKIKQYQAYWMTGTWGIQSPQFKLRTKSPYLLILDQQQNEIWSRIPFGI